jgi:hypothetical protein
MTTSGTERAAPRGAADPATLRALTRARGVTHDLADDLLTHLPDLGDITTQRALDAWVEQAADTLLALSEAMEERLIDLGRTNPATWGTTSGDTPGTAGRHITDAPRRTSGRS